MSTHEDQLKKEWPTVVYLWAFGLSGLPHPYHWATGLIGGVLGIPVGWAWYRWRGDVM